MLTLPAADLIYCGWSLPHCPGTPSAPRSGPTATPPRTCSVTANDWTPDPAASAFRPAPWTPSWPGWTSNTSKKPSSTATPFTGPSTGTITRSSPANPRKPGASQGLPHALPAPRTLSRATSTHQHQPPPHTSPAHRTDKRLQDQGRRRAAQNRLRTDAAYCRCAAAKAPLRRSQEYFSLSGPVACVRRGPAGLLLGDGHGADGLVVPGALPPSGPPRGFPPSRTRRLSTATES